MPASAWIRGREDKKKSARLITGRFFGLFSNFHFSFFFFFLCFLEGQRFSEGRKIGRFLNWIFQVYIQTLKHRWIFDNLSKNPVQNPVQKWVEKCTILAILDWIFQVSSQKCRSPNILTGPGKSSQKMIKTPFFDHFWTGFGRFRPKIPKVSTFLAWSEDQAKMADFLEARKISGLLKTKKKKEKIEEKNRKMKKKIFIFEGQKSARY